MGAERGSPRSIERVGFDRFSFDQAIDSRDDGATSQRGADTSGRLVDVGAIAWPEMPTEWLVLSSRRDTDPLELDIEHMPIVDGAIAERFVVDSDDRDLSSLIDKTTSDWLLSIDDDIGPIHLILDGAVQHGEGVATLFIARTSPATTGPDGRSEAERPIDMAHVAATALGLLTS